MVPGVDQQPTERNDLLARLLSGLYEAKRWLMIQKFCNTRLTDDVSREVIVALRLSVRTTGHDGIENATTGTAPGKRLQMRGISFSCKAVVDRSVRPTAVQPVPVIRTETGVEPGKQPSIGFLWCRRRIIPAYDCVPGLSIQRLRMNSIEPWPGKSRSGQEVDGSQAARAISSSIKGEAE